MENYSYSSYPESQTSSPRSREIDCESQSWDEPMSNYKVKLMCSYGGKIQPRPHDNQLSYIGGDTKILSVDRNIKFGAFLAKLSSLCDSEVCFKYQLPGEDLDALISVTNDEDLEHMMLEYDRLFRASAKPARLRLFLFMVNSISAGASFDSNSAKSDQQWFVEALNSAPSVPVDSSVGNVANPDFLFGLDKGAQPAVVAKVPEAMKPQAEIQQQIHELQRMQISGQDQVVYQQKSDGGEVIRVFGEGGEFYATQKVAENVAQVPQGLPVQMPVYWQNQSQATGGSYQVAPSGEQQVYIIPTPGGMYQGSTNFVQMSGQASQAQAPVQGYYSTTQRIVPDVYREQTFYTALAPQQVAQSNQQQQQPSAGIYAEGVGGRQPAEVGYTMTYDASGMPVYYANAGVTPAYQVVSGVAASAGQVASITQDGKVTIAKPN